ncbi:MAG: hypothetical protein J5701_06055 [Bacteroidales bacterium]|nr:hypothetical protein [Bacteroidales bacterium]
MERFRWLSLKKLNIIKIVYLLIILSVLSIQVKGQNDYVKYQTFDEYKLEGIGEKKIKRPYVLVKRENDTIFVVKSNDRKNVIKYVNRGDYWHTILQIEERWSFWETFCEKFIYNDTVVEYKYKYWHDYGYLIDSSKRSNIRINKGIYVHTKSICINLSIQGDDIKNLDNPYNEIKQFVVNYKEIFPLYLSSPGYQPRWYSIYEKHIAGNRLSIYEMKGVNREFTASKKMNSLGEFDNKGMLWWW